MLFLSNRAALSYSHYFLAGSSNHPPVLHHSLLVSLNLTLAFLNSFFIINLPSITLVQCAIFCGIAMNKIENLSNTLNSSKKLKTLNSILKKIFPRTWSGFTDKVYQKFKKLVFTFYGNCIAREKTFSSTLFYETSIKSILKFDQRNMRKKFQINITPGQRCKIDKKKNWFTKILVRLYSSLGFPKANTEVEFGI